MIKYINNIIDNLKEYEICGTESPWLWREARVQLPSMCPYLYPALLSRYLKLQPTKNTRFWEALSDCVMLFCLFSLWLNSALPLVP